MPYIRKEKRPEVDKILDPLIVYLKSKPMEEQDGIVNYVVSKMIWSLYPKKYFHLNRALGVLTAITHELYRRIVAPFEDEMIKERGDIK
ncbi:hypothetical protein HYW54_02320 [Candidatus Gottesmanbacteria bacterium]|nr:hypothetical protein [Candidatus Gottesmanbacteria bacterium]